jgi:nucleotide-binding universal stress UspA family protein
MGSIAEKVIRHVTCPVLAVGPHVGALSLDRFGHILYATDFSSGSKGALTYALLLAEQDRAELTMLHVIQTEPAYEAEVGYWKRQDREHISQLIPTDLDLAYKPEIEVEAGDPAEQILLLAETRGAELIVMGSHAGTLSTHFPWTTLHHVLQKAHCPVLTVRAA